MNILVLGGSGFIGAYLSEQLVQAGHNVTVFHLPGASKKNILSIENEIRLIEGDFNNLVDIELALINIEVVVHLVSATLPGNSLLNPAYDAQMNIVSSVSFFEQCAKSGVRKVIFISSGGTVYGVPERIPINESHPLNPISPYGVSKLAIEKYLAMYSYQYKLDYVILRLSNPYGPRQDPKRGQGVIAAWIQKIATNQAIEIWGDGKVIRDYIYITDAINAIYSAILKETNCNIFNIGSGVGYSLLELHNKFELALSKSIDIDYKNSQNVDVPVNILDISVASNLLEWSPKVSILDGIKLSWEGNY